MTYTVCIEDLQQVVSSPQCVAMLMCRTLDVSLHLLIPFEKLITK